MPGYLSYTDARSHLREVLDDAERGRVVKVKRGDGRYAMADADRLRDYFAKTTSPRLRLAFEDGRWIASMDCRPFMAEAADLETAISELIQYLREYSEAWESRYQSAPNHRDSWGLVQLISLSDDQQLQDWLRSDGKATDANMDEELVRG